MTPVRSCEFRCCYKTVALVTALLVLLPAACKKESSSSPGSGAGEPEPDEAPPPPSVRPQLLSVRQLLSETERAEVDVGGLLIDFGSTDQHKYTLGGWQNGWHGLKSAEDGSSSTAITARSASVFLARRGPARDVRQVVLRARAPGGARLSVAADGKALGNMDLPDAFATVSLAIPAGSLRSSARKLDLVFQGKGKGIRAEVDWLWLGEAEGGAPPAPAPRVAPIVLGSSTRRALASPTPRSYSFFLEVPAAAKLVFDYGADKNTRFQVTATADGADPVTLFEGEARPNRWLEGVADLATLAGKAVRLDLSTSGQGSAGWGDPEIMVSPGDKPAPAPVARRAPRNVIVLVIDTVRADVFKAFDPNSRVETPAFDALSAESTTFVNALANENWTKPSVATLLSGLYPVTHQTKRDPDVLNRRIRVLPEHLREEGFRTAAFIANGYVSEKFGFERGWDDYTNYIRENKVSEAERVYTDAWKWVEKNGKDRFFLYIQTIDPHVPYAVPDSYLETYFPEPYKGSLGKRLDGGKQVEISSGKRKITDEDKRWIRALYDAEVTYHDKHMGDFFEALRGKALLDDTLVIITNDHGEEIGEHGRYGHGHSLYQELIRAPLTVRYPAMFPAGQQVNEVVENVDLFPTILDVLELRAVPGLEGFSLLPWLEGRPPMTPSYGVSEFLDNYRAVRVGSWKLIATPSGGGKLFELASPEGEQEDRAENAPIARRLCELHLAEALAVPSKPARFGGGGGPHRQFKPGQVKQDPELRRQLEALGYFGEAK